MRLPADFHIMFIRNIFTGCTVENQFRKEKTSCSYLTPGCSIKHMSFASNNDDVCNISVDIKITADGDNGDLLFVIAKEYPFLSLFIYLNFQNK